MTSLYDQSIPPIILSLQNLSAILKKAVAYADNEKNNVSREKLTTNRLIEDMKPLTYQVQSCSNTAKFIAVRVGGMENEVLEDNEETFEELQARIAKTISILESVKPESMNGKEQQQIIMETKSMGNFIFTGQNYLSTFALPNFHFHLTTAYCLLRQQGVPIGAMDYFGDVFRKQE